MADFKDCLVVIYDSGKSNGGKSNLIAKAIVTYHDKSSMLIEVSNALEKVETGSRLNILIVHNDGVSEFSGIARKSRILDTREITLYKERKRGARSSVRHTLNSPAHIRGLYARPAEEQFDPPLQIVVENISSTGILIIVPADIADLEIGSILEIDVNINGRHAILLGKIIRKQANDNNAFRLGCELVFRK